METNVDIVNRFFKALKTLKEERVIRGLKTFTTRYELNRWNIKTLEKAPERGIFQVVWLAYLVEDYKISPLWLLTGRGAFWQAGYNGEKVKKVQITGKRNATPVQVAVNQQPKA